MSGPEKVEPEQAPALQGGSPAGSPPPADPPSPPVDPPPQPAGPSAEPADPYDTICAAITAPAFMDAAQAAQLVWVRIPGYPHWPAQVITPAEVARHPNLARSRPKVPAAPVLFFGEYTFGWATRANLMTWSEGVAKGCQLREQPQLRIGVSEAAAFVSVSGPRSAPPSWWMAPPAPGIEGAGLATLISYFPASPVKKPAPKAKPTGSIKASGAEKPPAAPSRAGKVRWSVRDTLRPLVNRLRRLFPQLADEEAPSVSEDLIEWIRGYFGNAIDLNALKGKNANDLMAEMFSRQIGKAITPAQVAACFSSAHLDLLALRSLGVDPTTWDLPLAGGPRRRAPAAPRAGPGRPTAAATAAAAATAPAYTPILTDPLAPRMPVVNGRLVVPSRMRGRPPSVAAAADGEDAAVPAAAAVPSKDDPPSYVHVKQNVWVSRSRPKRLPKDEISVCCCLPPPLVALLPPADSVHAALETESMELDVAPPGGVKAEPAVAVAVEDGDDCKAEPMEEELSDEAVVRSMVAAIFAPYMGGSAPVEDAGAAGAAPVAAAPAPLPPLAPGRASRAPRAASAGAASAFAAARGPARAGSSSSLDAGAPVGAGPRDGCRIGCLNRLSFIHCDPRTCPAGDRCSNRPFYQLECPGMEVFLTADKGWGVRATEPIPAGSFVVEYAGEVVDENEMNARMNEARSRQEPHFYMMEMGPGLIIDARPKGNVARLLNSSCDPNCETQKWHDAATGEVRVGIFTLRDVAPGEELVYDYHFQQLYGQSDAEGEYRCRCGAAKCRGTMDATLDRAADCGRRVEVWWENDQCYYAGTVTSYSAVTGKHAILYDDGEIEKLDLTQHRHRWVEGPAPVPSPAAPVAPAVAAVDGVAPVVSADAAHLHVPAPGAVSAVPEGAAVAMEVEAPVAVPVPVAAVEPLPAIAAVLGPALAAAQTTASPQRFASQNSEELAGSPAPGAGSPPSSSVPQKRKRGRPPGPARTKMLAMTVEQPAEGSLPPDLAATAAELLPPGATLTALSLPALRETLAPALAESEAHVAMLGTVLTSHAPDSPKENGNVGAVLAVSNGVAAAPAEPHKEPTPAALAAEDVEMTDAEAEVPETAAQGAVCLELEVTPAPDGSGAEVVQVRLQIAGSPSETPRTAVHPVSGGPAPAHVLQEAQAQRSSGMPPIIVGAAMLGSPVIPAFLALKQSHLVTSLRAQLAGTDCFGVAATHCSLAAERLGALRKFLDTATLGGEPQAVVIENPGAEAVAGNLHGNGKGGAPGRSRRTTAAAAAASPPSVSGRGRRRQRKVWGDDYVDDVSDADAVAQTAPKGAAAVPAPAPGQAGTAQEAAASGRSRRSTRGRPSSKAAAPAAAAEAEAAAEPAPAADAEPADQAAEPMETEDAGVPAAAAAAAGDEAPEAAETEAPAAAKANGGAEPALQASTEDAGAASDSQAAVEAAAATLLAQQQAAPPPAAYAPPAPFRRSGPTPGSTGLPARTILVAKRLTNSDVTKGRILLPRAAVEANLSFAIGRPHSLAAKDHLGAAWEFTLQSWANGMESRRVYVLEHAAEYIRAHALRLDDVIGISCTQGGEFLVEYNTEEVCAAAESQQAARGAGAPAPPVAMPQGPSCVNPLIQHNAGRCIRSPYCNKPAGHPGFCQRTPGAGRGRRPGHAPRPPPAAPAAPAAPIDQPLPLRRPSLEDFRRAKRMRRPSSKAISTQYRLSTEEEDAYSDGAEDSDADSDWPEEERAALAREIKEATPPPQMDPSVPPVFQMAADPTAPTVAPPPVPAPVHSAMRPHMPQSLMSPLRPQRQASMSAVSPTGPAMADLNPLPPPPLGTVADAAEAAMAAALMPNGTASGMDDLLPTVPDLNLPDSLAGSSPRGVGAAAGPGGDALGISGLGGFGVSAPPPQQPQYAGPPLFGGAAPVNPPGVGLPGSAGAQGPEHGSGGKGTFDFMTFLNHENPR